MALRSNVRLDMGLPHGTDELGSDNEEASLQLQW